MHRFRLFFGIHPGIGPRPIEPARPLELFHRSPKPGAIVG
jgi:hypothetical protein